MPIILALRRLRPEDCKFEASLGYIGSSRPLSQNKQTLKFQKKKKKKNPKTPFPDHSYEATVLEGTLDNI
jgi:hypothetical protein